MPSEKGLTVRQLILLLEQMPMDARPRVWRADDDPNCASYVSIVGVEMKGLSERGPFNALQPDPASRVTFVVLETNASKGLGTGF